MDLAIPAIGYKNHISIDRRYRLGFGRTPRILRRLRIRRWKTTDASAHDGARLRGGLLDRSNTHRSAANEQYMGRNGFTLMVHHKKSPHRDMPVHTKRSYAGKIVIRPRVEHVFADQKCRMGLVIRKVGIRRAKMKSASPTSSTISGGTYISNASTPPHTTGKPHTQVDNQRQDENPIGAFTPMFKLSATQR